MRIKTKNLKKELLGLAKVLKINQNQEKGHHNRMYPSKEENPLGKIYPSHNNKIILPIRNNLVYNFNKALNLNHNLVLNLTLKIHHNLILNRNQVLKSKKAKDSKI